MENIKDCEQSVLGACLIDNKCVGLAIQRLRPEDFFKELHSKIFVEIIKLNAEGVPIDSVILYDRLKNIKDISVYLTDLQNCIPTTANINYYIDRMLEESRKRRLNALCEKIQGTDDIEEKERLAGQMSIAEKTTDEFPENIKDFITKDIAQADNLWGDGILQPMSRLFVGGQSKIGKSFFVINLALSLASARPFLNFPVPRPLKMLLLQSELTDRNLQLRLQKMTDGMEGVPDNLYIKSIRGMKLDNESDCMKLSGILDTIKPDVLCIDPLACFHTLDENSASEMRTLLDNLDRLITKHKMALIISHHHRKPSQFENQGGGQLRGSSVLFDWGDSYITMNDSGGNARSVLFTLRNAQSPPKMIIGLNDRLLYEVYGVEGQSKVDETLIYDLIDSEGGIIGNKELIVKIMEQSKCSDKTASRRLKSLDGKTLISNGERKDKTWKRNEIQSDKTIGHDVQKVSCPKEKAPDLVEKAIEMFNGIQLDTPQTDKVGCPKGKG